MSNVATLNALMRTDFMSFLHRVFLELHPGVPFYENWHIEAMAWALGEIARGKRRRQIIEVPPRSLKSIAASVAFVAWVLGKDPTRKIIVVSYAQSLAAIHSAACRQVMKSDWYRALFPNTVISDLKDTEPYFRTTAGGFRDATSIGGTLTGKGADIIIIDDPAKPEEMTSEALRDSVNLWYRQTLISRLNDKRTGSILLVMQRLNVDDLAGHVRQLDNWEILTLPAIANEFERIQIGPERWHERAPNEVLDPEREPIEELHRLKQSMGSYLFSAQYQQDPLPADGGVIEWRWFKTFSIPPKIERCRIVQSWDTAAKANEHNDYSVCTTWAVIDDHYYLLDVHRARLSFPDLLLKVLSLGQRFKPNEVLIEDSAAGMQLYPLIRLNRPIGMPEPRMLRPEKDKITRLVGSSAAVEQGRVLIPFSAPWLDDFRTELIQFPHGKYDDQVDSFSQFILYEEKRRRGGARIESRRMFERPDDKPKRSNLF